jgi:hypothetical protein
MRLDQLSVALRPRTPWEAMDLGQALVRRHAAALWKPWFALAVPAFVVCNALAWWTERMWMAMLAMWWLKPLFDRVPLYVLSRAVFGVVPAPVQTLRSPQVWAPGQLALWLSWRRLNPGRALLLPVDLLEGPRGAARRERVRVLQQAIQSQAWGLSLACLCLELAVFGSLWTLALVLAVPAELLPDSARIVVQTFFETPSPLAQLGTNFVAFLAMAAIGPFYVGAGFGLYLNRRTQLEAWDVELAFRRLAERAQAALSGTGAVLLALALACPLLLAPGRALAAAPAGVAAQDAGEDAGENDEDEEDDEDYVDEATPQEIVGPHWQAHDDRFARGVKKTYEDPLLSPRRTVEYWARRDRDQAREPDAVNDAPPEWLKPIGKLLALLGEFGVWIVAGVALALLLWKLPAWLPWVRELRERGPAPPPILEHADAVVEPLPDDVPAAVRSLWAAGNARAALALLYRASVERVADALGKPMPPGATEADCLRRARGLPEETRAAFAHVVRVWQGAAYGHRLPDAAAFDALLAAWSRGLGMRA